MDDERSNSTDKESSSEDILDLSVLQELDFGPDWGSETIESKARRTPTRDPKSKGKKPFRRGKTEGPRVRGKIAKPTRPPEPKHLVSFVPEEVPFSNLIREMRTSCRTYPLFDLAKVILGKPERFVVLASPVEKPGEEPPNYYVTKADGLPFTTREEAYRHLMGHHGESFFEVEEREAEPPKGAFSVVNKCGITGKLLAPPNYHRYTELIREHHATQLSNMPWEKFQIRIETDQNAEAVAAWLDSMKKIHIYRLKDCSGDEPESFDTREALQRFLFGQRFPKLIKKVSKTRFSGVRLAELPTGVLKRDIEQALEEQRRYPLSTANMLRSRFRRLNFTVYKRGSKGITFVCVVKRKSRTPDAVFADSIQALLHFLDENTRSRKNELIESHLGFSQGKRTEKQEELVRQLARDLRWVVTEGYVIEFADGTLLPSPVASIQKTSRKRVKAIATETASSEEAKSEKKATAVTTELAEKVENPSSPCEET